MFDSILTIINTKEVSINAFQQSRKSFLRKKGKKDKRFETCSQKKTYICKQNNIFQLVKIVH